MFRYRPEWSTAGGPGVTTFHFRSDSGPTAIANATRTFFNSLAALLPTDVSITFPGEVDEVDVETNELVGTTSVTPPATVTGTGAGAYAAPTGARVRWNTGDILRGRRVIGTTFLVPLVATAYDTAGSLTPTVISTLQTSAAALLATPGAALVVYSRPTAPTAADGSLHAVSGPAVPDLAAVLRSRRD